MKLLQKLFLLIVFGFISSCGSQKMKVKTITKTVRDTVVIKEVKEISNTPIYKSAELKDYSVDGTFFPAVGQDDRIKFLVLHYTAMDNQGSIKVLTQRQVSSHYLVPDNENNEIFILVSEDKRAWHAGYSHWGKRDNLNDTSIGIEIVNNGFRDSGGEMIFYPYTEKQIKKVGELAKDIVKRYNIEAQNVIGHADVAPQRKYDPGPLFPWKRLYDEYGVGAWYNEEDKQSFLSSFPYAEMDQTSFILSAQGEFQKYGYEIEKTGVWDEQTEKVIRVFQFHFRPYKYDGRMDAETWAILKALNKRYRD